MSKYFFLFFIQIVILASCKIEGNRAKDNYLITKEFNELNYIYHFNKKELEDSRIDPVLYKPKIVNISGQVKAQLYAGDTLLRFVRYFKSEKNQADSSIQLFRLLKLTNNERSEIPSELFGCHFLGAYNSSNQDLPDNYNCFYTNENDDLLNVIQLFKLGNVFVALLYKKDSIDPTTKYKYDVARLFETKRELNLADSIRMKLH